ncbi:MAG: phosphatidylglycerophosphatase A [Candidatus Thiodiazotropha sp.]
MNTPNPPDLRNPLHLLAFGFGSGLAPKAPGTFGTLAAVPVYLLLQPLPSSLYLLLLAGGFLAGIAICGRTSRDLGVHDHGGIVWDEIIGFLVTMTPVVHNGWWWILPGFALFRLFDIFKPWPIGWLDRRLQGGLGIMLDDLVAGLFAAVLLGLAHWAWF